MGQNASLARGRFLTANAGAYAYTGKNATLVYFSLFPAEADVRLGVIYGPGGIYTGAYAPPAAKQPIYIFDD
jgi:hypothetical protein